jgi:excisionase family DNA binding protein
MAQQRSTPSAHGTTVVAEAQLLTLLEAAARLRVSRRTLWTLTRRDGLRALRIGRAIRYDVRDLIAWIDAGCPAGARASNGVADSQEVNHVS